MIVLRYLWMVLLLFLPMTFGCFGQQWQKAPTLSAHAAEISIDGGLFGPKGHAYLDAEGKVRVERDPDTGNVTAIEGELSRVPVIEAEGGTRGELQLQFTQMQEARWMEQLRFIHEELAYWRQFAIAKAGGVTYEGHGWTVPGLGTMTDELAEALSAINARLDAIEEQLQPDEEEPPLDDEGGG